MDLVSTRVARVPAAGTAENFMGMALEAARRAGLAGEAPIGACLVRDGVVIVSGANAVIGTLDITAHAEVAVIRHACQRLRTLSLAGAELYCTVEPCPMCLAACHYAQIKRVTFAARLADLQELTGQELLPAKSCSGTTGVALNGDCRRADSLALLQTWAAGRKHR